MTPFEAVTHADPYTCYSQLRYKGDLYFDTRLGCWVASGATVIQAMLLHPDLLVRPSHEPVPPSISQTAADQVFGNLMRMNEGHRHQCPRAAIEPVLASVPPAEIAALVAQLIKTDCSADSLNALMFTLPVSVLCALMGFDAQQISTVAALTCDFVACLSPLSNEPQLRNADIAATRLSQMFNLLLMDEYGPARCSTLSAQVNDRVQRWCRLEQHRQSQSEGRAQVFEDYRLRIAHVLRDYSLIERSEAPADSRKAHP